MKHVRNSYPLMIIMGNYILNTLKIKVSYFTDLVLVYNGEKTVSAGILLQCIGLFIWMEKLSSPNLF